VDPRIVDRAGDAVRGEEVVDPWPIGPLLQERADQGAPQKARGTRDEDAHRDSC
jgi:hypothetical protein